MSTDAPQQAGIAAPAPSEGAIAARAKALEIASRLSSSVLGKHSREEPLSGPRGDGTSWPVSDGSGHAAPTPAPYQRNNSGSGLGKYERKIFVPVQERPDINFLGLLIGPRGSTQQRMQADSGSRIVIRGRGSSKDGNEENSNEDMHVMVFADTEEQVEKGAQLVSDLLFNPEAQAATKSAQLSQLGHAAAAAAAAAVPYGAGAGPRSNLVLSGSMYAEDVNYPTFRGMGEVKRSIKVPAERVGQIIGRGGETIKMLQDNTGAHIQVAREFDSADALFKTISIEGSEEQVAGAEQHIQRIITENDQRDQQRGMQFQPQQQQQQQQQQPQQQQQQSQQVPPPPQQDQYGMPSAGPVMQAYGNAPVPSQYGGSAGPYGAAPSPVGGGYGVQTFMMQIPSDAVGLLIGRAGATIRQIQLQSGSSVQVQRDSDAAPNAPMRDVTLQGTEQQITMARSDIEGLMRAHQSGGSDTPAMPGMTITKMSVSNSSVGVIIGRGGETIKGIQARTGARVQIAKDMQQPNRDVTLSGSESAVTQAKAEIEVLASGRGNDFGAYGAYDQYGAVAAAPVIDPYSQAAAAYGQPQQQQQPETQQSYEVKYAQYVKEYYAYYGQYPPDAYGQQPGAEATSASEAPASSI